MRRPRLRRNDRRPGRGWRGGPASNGWDALAGGRRQGTGRRRHRRRPGRAGGVPRGGDGGGRDDRLGGGGVRPGPGRDRRRGGQVRGAAVRPVAREALATYAGLDFIRGLRVLPAELGGDAGLVGAAALLDASRGLARHMLSAPIAQALQHRGQRQRRTPKSSSAHTAGRCPRRGGRGFLASTSFMEVANEHALGDVRDAAAKVGGSHRARRAAARGRCPSSARRGRSAPRRSDTHLMSLLGNGHRNLLEADNLVSTLFFGSIAPRVDDMERDRRNRRPGARRPARRRGVWGRRHSPTHSSRGCPTRPTARSAPGGSRLLGALMLFWYIGTLAALIAVSGCGRANGAATSPPSAHGVLAVLPTVTVLVPINNRIGAWRANDECRTADPRQTMGPAARGAGGPACRDVHPADSSHRVNRRAIRAR